MMQRVGRIVSVLTRRPLPAAAAIGAALFLGGCVFQSTYNTMQQQQAIEASLRAEINADQVEIEQT